MENRVVTLDRCKDAIMVYWQTGNTELLQEVGCDIRAEYEAAQQKMHMTAFGRRLAWLFFCFILMLSMVLIIIGGR